MKNSILFIFLIFQCIVFAQLSELEQMRKKFPNNKEVITVQKNKITISIVDDSLVIDDYHYEEQMLLTNEHTGLRQKAIQYTSFSKIQDLVAKTLVPKKNGKYKTFKVTEFKEKDVLSGAIFHDDTKEIKFYYSNLQEGAKMVHSYHQQEKEPRFINGFFFQSYYPIDYAEFSIQAPNTVNIAYQYFNILEKDLVFTKTENKGIITYTWIRKNIPALKYETESPNPRYYMPHIIPYIKDYTINGEKTRLLTDVGDLYNWYFGMVENVNQDEDPILKNIADSVTANATTEIEKVKAIFYWVQDNIKYVAFEAGLGGFIPRNANTICTKRYGDCKDMASIITHMLKLVGIKSYLTWIGSNHIPYTYNLPTPAVDNHMIATYIDNEKYYFLDATGQHTPFGFPTSFIQGKEALIGLGKNKYKIVKVPTIDAQQSIYKDVIKLQIEGKKVIGKGQASFSGYQKIMISEKIAGKTENDKKTFFTSFFSKGSNKFLIDSQDDHNLHDRDKDYVVNYNFNIDDYARFNDDEIYINLNLDKIFNNDRVKKDRIHSIQRRFNGTFQFEISFEIPPGYTLDYIPESQQTTYDNFSFSIQYQQKNNSVTLQSNFQIKQLILHPEDFDTWNAMNRTLSEAYNDVIILKKNN